MKTKLLLCLITLSFLTTLGWAGSPKGYLRLRGVVPVKTSVTMDYNKDGALVPTLRTNAVEGSARIPKIRTSRAPASFGGVEKVEVIAP